MLPSQRERIAQAIKENSLVDPSPAATDPAWRLIQQACAAELPIGFGLLDSFLAGPDLPRRVSLVVFELPRNRWLRLELKDTLSLNQSENLSCEQIELLGRLCRTE